MLAIFITILRIIGIILLSVLGVVVGLALLILLVPVRYRVSGSYDKNVIFEAKVTYLLHILSIVFRYNENGELIIRVFGIRIDKLLNRPRKERRASGKKSDNVTTEVHESAEVKSDEKATEPHESADVKLDEVVTEAHGSVEKKSDAKATENSGTDKKLEDKAVDTQSEEKSGSSLRDRYNSLMKYVEILNADMTKKAFNTCRKRAGRLIKSVLPKKLKIVVTYGLTNPYTTTQIMSVYNAFYTYLGRGLVLNPVYDDKVLEVKGYARGRIILAPVLWNVLLVVIDKNCKDFYYTIRGQK